MMGRCQFACGGSTLNIYAVHTGRNGFSGYKMQLQILLDYSKHYSSLSSPAVMNWTARDVGENSWNI